MWEVGKTSEFILKQPREGGGAPGLGMSASKPPAPMAAGASRHSRNRRRVCGARRRLQLVSPFLQISAPISGGRHGG